MRVYSATYEAEHDVIMLTRDSVISAQSLNRVTVNFTVTALLYHAYDKDRTSPPRSICLQTRCSGLLVDLIILSSPSLQMAICLTYRPCSAGPA